MPAALASSFSAEDMVLLDLIGRHDLEIEVFTLDTGRLPEETHRVIAEARRRYARPIKVLSPDSSAVEGYVAEHGPNGFYECIAARQRCCAIRKVEPLARALTGKRAWITGQRREHSPTRGGLAVAEWDAERFIAKFNPLAGWSAADVWAYVRAHGVPYNVLHNRGYPSIGCAPCTRAVAPGDGPRAGRWWWKSSETKECGMHPAIRRHVASPAAAE